MQFFTAAFAVMAGVASAQSVQVVTVSSMNGSLTYMPDNIRAEVGSMVQFQFVAGNHTVTQSPFDQPCQPISTIMSNVTGFHSGFMPTSASQSTGMVPTYSVMINNTKPIWLYCAQGRHCQAGMVMVINENTAANASRSLTNYKDLAAMASTQVPSTGTTGGTSGSSPSAPAGSTGPITSAGSVVRIGSPFGCAVFAAALALTLL